MIQLHAQDETLTTVAKQNCQVLYLLARLPLLEPKDVVPFVLGKGFFEARSKLQTVLLLYQTVCQRICDLLHVCIGLTSSYSEKQFFIQLRRDVFNKRELKNINLSHPFINANVELKNL